MSKQEATRLADALDAAWRPGCGHPGISAAANKLRQWPDGEPFCYLRQTSSERNPPHGWAVYCSGQPEDLPLYTAPPDSAARIAELEARRDALLDERKLQQEVLVETRAVLKVAGEALKDVLEEAKWSTDSEWEKDRAAKALQQIKEAQR